MSSAAPTRSAFEFEGVVRFTKVGTSYLGATIVLIMAAVNTGNNALYVGVALMLGSLLLSGIASKGGLKHLRAEIGGMDDVWAGRKAHGVLRIHNDSRIWNVRDVVITSKALAEPVLVPVVARRSSVQVDASFLFTRRGLAHVESIDSYTRYPFGFFLKKRRLRVSSDVLVFPHILGGSDLREQFEALVGDTNAANRPGPGSEIHSFREYARGDSMRQVHWKKSASVGRWIMKQTDADASSSVHVLVDPYKPKHVTEEQLERMISEAATFVYEAIERGYDVSLSLPRVTVRAREHEPGVPLFRALALIEATHEPLHHAVERNTVVFACAPRELHAHERVLINVPAMPVEGGARG